MQSGIEVGEEEARPAPTPIPSSGSFRRRQRQSTEEAPESFSELSPTSYSHISRSCREGGLRIGPSPHIAQLRPVLGNWINFLTADHSIVSTHQPRRKRQVDQALHEPLLNNAYRQEQQQQCLRREQRSNTILPTTTATSTPTTTTSSSRSSGYIPSSSQSALTAAAAAAGFQQQQHQASPSLPAAVAACISGLPHLNHIAATTATTPASAAATTSSSRSYQALEAGAMAFSSSTPFHSQSYVQPFPPGSAAGPAAGGKVGKKTDGTMSFAKIQNDISYGLINGVLGIPAMISYAAIVYQDKMYSKVLGQLARFAFFSATMHQLAFMCCSSLRFAVGQPQDVGLIFLSAMATAVADIGREEGLGEDVIVGTTLVTLSVATLFVGALTYAVAKLRLATLVQYIPLPVVAGYLGYVGYFIVAAGFSLGTGAHIEGFTSWINILHKAALIKLVPMAVAAAALLCCMTWARSPWALPALLLALPAAFHLALAASGISLEEAQDQGWCMRPEGDSTQQFWELYQLFNIKDWQLNGLYLPALLWQIPKMFGLFFVVVFGSCLDVAAIQADLPEPIDFNRELATVGLSNMVVGFSGSGFTGSYIFSQTLFSMRAGVSTRVHGAIIAGIEALVFILPFSVVQYLPNFFFGALMLVFGGRITADWLVASYSKVTPVEYGLLLATFLAIMQFNLEIGVMVGMLLCTLFAAFTYARMNITAFSVVPSRSAAVRTYKERQLLELLNNKLLAVSLSGYVFFASSVTIRDRVLKIACAIVQGAAHPSVTSSPSVGVTDGSLDDAVTTWSCDASYTLPRARSLVCSALSRVTLADVRVKGLEAAAPAFVLLDFRRVSGVDAAAAQTFGTLARSLRHMGVELVLTRLTSGTIRRLFAAHGVIHPRYALASRSEPLHAGGPERSLAAALAMEQEEEDEEGQYCRLFDTMNEGAQYAEDKLLDLARGAGLVPASDDTITLEELLEAHLLSDESSSPPSPTSAAAVGATAAAAGVTAAASGTAGNATWEVAAASCDAGWLGLDLAAVASSLRKYVVPRRVGPGTVLFSWDEVPQEFFLILKGGVSLQLKNQVAATLGSLPLDTSLLPHHLHYHETRSFAAGPGSVVGSTDFLLRVPSTFWATTATECELLVVDESGWRDMSSRDPVALAGLQMVLLRDACLRETYAYETLDRAATT